MRAENESGSEEGDGGGERAEKWSESERKEAGGDGAIHHHFFYLVFFYLGVFRTRFETRFIMCTKRVTGNKNATK